MCEIVAQWESLSFLYFPFLFSATELNAPIRIITPQRLRTFALCLITLFSSFFHYQHQFSRDACLNESLEELDVVSAYTLGRSFLLAARFNWQSKLITPLLAKKKYILSIPLGEEDIYLGTESKLLLAPRG